MGTHDAAAVLGVSVSTVQKMVAAGHLPAWKTSGGHRRIRMDDLRRVASEMRVPGPVQALSSLPGAAPGTPLDILVVEDNPVAVRALTAVLEQYGPRVRVRVAADAAEALLLLGESAPGLLLTDLVMEPFDGFHLLRVLARSERLARVPAIVVTEMPEAEIAARGGLPPGVTVLRKPVPPERLMGFVDAVLSLRT